MPEKEIKQKKDRTKNLIPMNARPLEERLAICRKAGKASGESRRAKKSIKDCLELILSLNCKDREMNNKKDEAGIQEDFTNKLAMSLAIWEKATKGQDVAAFNAIRDTIGEKISQQNITFGKSEDDKLTAALKDLAKDL